MYECFRERHQHLCVIRSQGCNFTWPLNALWWDKIIKHRCARATAIGQIRTFSVMQQPPLVSDLMHARPIVCLADSSRAQRPTTAKSGPLASLMKCYCNYRGREQNISALCCRACVRYTSVTLLYGAVMAGSCTRNDAFHRFLDPALSNRVLEFWHM